jgi:uncharacterized protein YegP (UPF0339 family)
MALTSQGGIVGGLLAPKQYRFTVRLSRDGQFYFTYHDSRGNTEPICTSETYTSKESCVDAINAIRSGAANASFEDLSQ